MSNYDVIFYETQNGKQPAKEFLLSLDPKMRAKMLRTIEIVGENGPALREPYSKPLEDGIFELRAKVGSDISRVLYFFYVGKGLSGSDRTFQDEFFLSVSCFSGMGLCSIAPPKGFPIALWKPYAAKHFVSLGISGFLS